LIEIYTDGSCINNKDKGTNIGAWVAIIFYNNKKIILEEVVENTTHNRMELMAVIKSLEYLEDQEIAYEKVAVYTDSQYVEQIKSRKQKLVNQNFITGKGTEIQNADLVKRLIILTDKLKPEFIKVKAHQKHGDLANYNREADKLVRKLVRAYVNEKS
jgi:ribonuclease HI